MTIEEFIAELNGTDWFSKCCIPNEKYKVIHSIFEAYDQYNRKYIQTWEPQIQALEALAVKSIGDEETDRIFSHISSAMGDILWSKWEAFIERQDLYEESGLENEMLDMVMRDLSWAFIEQHLGREGFFCGLLKIYKEGYLPCAWEGEYPGGRAVVL